MADHELSESAARGIAAKVLNANPLAVVDEEVALVRAGYAAANLAEARREGAREALETLRVQFYHRVAVDRDIALSVIAHVERHKYPAPAPEAVTLTCALCGGDITGEDDVFLRHKADGAADAHLDRDACIASLAARLAKVGAA